MPNQPGTPSPGTFRSGQALSAADLNKIVRALVQRLTGGTGVRVRAFGDQVVIESTLSPPRKSDKAITDKVGRIVSGSGSGPYVVDVYDDGLDEIATEQVDAYPIEGTDYAANTAVIIVWVPDAASGEGRWYFDKSSTVSVKPGSVLSGSGTGPYSVREYADGFEEDYTGIITAYAMQCASGESFPSGLRVTLFHVPTADAGAGRWYFQGPIWVAS